MIPVRDSPKPPPERLSLTRPVINSSQRVWLVLAGADKASALGLALAGASHDEVPAAGIKGRRRTVFFVDADAAAEVPETLIDARLLTSDRERMPRRDPARASKRAGQWPAPFRRSGGASRQSCGVICPRRVRSCVSASSRSAAASSSVRRSFT